MLRALSPSSRDTPSPLVGAEGSGGANAGIVPIHSPRVRTPLSLCYVPEGYAGEGGGERSFTHSPLIKTLGMYES